MQRTANDLLDQGIAFGTRLLTPFEQVEIKGGFGAAAGEKVSSPSQL